MDDDEMRAAIVHALCTDHGHASRAGGLGCRTCLRRADAVLDVVSDELDAARARVAELEAELRTAAEVLCDVGKAALVVKTTLTKPYSDAPDQSPWSRFMESPARAAFNLGTQLRRITPKDDR